MQFTSLNFAIFFAIVFAGYWLLRNNYKWQNVLLLVSSYVFYCIWDYRLLGLLIVISTISWLSGHLIDRNRDNSQLSKFICGTSVIVCVLILALFKYYGFFVSEVAKLFHIGKPDGLLSKIILPLGISFYTFKSISYIVDVYRNKTCSIKNPIPVFLYVSFFPQLLAGPIELSHSFLPQICSRREFDYDQSVDSVRQILWGLFKKVVVADQCAIYVDNVYCNYSTQCGSALLIAAVLYSFQIYADFSGYSDISIGVSRLLGFKISPNFQTPYFSRSIVEFWRRWHISLTTWFKEYVYFPLGGSRCSLYKVVRNTSVVFILSGLWHGANWTYLIWGIYYALLFLPLVLTGRNKRYKSGAVDGKDHAGLNDFVQIISTFFIVMIGWIIFRAENISSAIDFFCGMFQWGTLRAGYRFLTWPDVRLDTLLVIMMVVIEWFSRGQETPLMVLKGKGKVIPSLVYIGLSIMIFWFWTDSSMFVYQQF